MVSEEEGVPPQAIGPDSVAREGRGSFLVDLFEEDRQMIMKMSVFEIEAMPSIRLYQRFFIFVISFDYDIVITKSSFCPNLW